MTYDNGDVVDIDREADTMSDEEWEMLRAHSVPHFTTNGRCMCGCRNCLARGGCICKDCDHDAMCGKVYHAP